MTHSQKTRIFGVALAVSAAILLGSAAGAYAAGKPTQLASADKVEMPVSTQPARKTVRVLSIHGHENCAYVRLNRGGSECLRKF